MWQRRRPPLRLISRDVVSDALGRGEHWDPHVYDALEPYLDGDVVDVGANVGGLTIRFAQVAPRVIAFEPNPDMFECLVENTAGLSVVCLNRGVYSVETFIRPDVTGYGPSSWAWPIGTHGTPAGPADWPDSEQRVSAIKVDCQGADLHVLKGLEHFIVRDRPHIVFEFEKELAQTHGDTWDDYEHWLESHNYQLRQIKDGHGDYLASPQ